ncbi:peptide deformylase [SAR86 cluster bacterium]|nr:peptide deformylase [SAR86 cluster bacterium]|tara:strand:- start:243 stop:782 length:540 start_codon:yes stop_codon:yes gene_type:complete
MLGHKDILKMGNPILRQIAEPFSHDEIKSSATKSLIKRMWKIMDEAGGIGLAAPQIAVSKQLAIIRLDESSERYPGIESSPEYIMFNPVINYLTEETQGHWEGCLSVPGLRGYVERPSKIAVNYTNENLESNILNLDGFLATVFQHEIDHLFGKLYIDRVFNKELIMYEDEFLKINENV